MKKATNDQNHKVNGKTKNTPDSIVDSEDATENGDKHDSSDTSAVMNNDTKKKKKNKSKQKEKQLLKKEARLLREKTLSEGFESFNFSAFASNDEQSDVEPFQNGNSQNEETSRNSSQKRIHKRTADNNKPKRRKGTQTA